MWRSVCGPVTDWAMRVNRLFKLLVVGGAVLGAPWGLVAGGGGVSGW